MSTEIIKPIFGMSKNWWCHIKIMKDQKHLGMLDILYEILNTYWMTSIFVWMKEDIISDF